MLSIKSINSTISQLSRRTPLQSVLIVPFVIQIIAVVGLTGYLSFRSAKEAVDRVAIQLSGEITDRIEQHVLNYLNKSHLVQSAIAASIYSETLNLDDFSQLKTYFWNQMRRMNYTPFVYFANPKGEFIGVKRLDNDQTVLYIKDASTASERKGYVLDSEGNRTDNLIESIVYEPQNRDWYKVAIQTRKPTWSPIYRFASGGYTVLGISPVTPIYNLQTGETRGVLANNLSLSQISNFLTDLRISSHGEAFIMERSGEIVASSANESTNSDPKPERLQAKDSSDPVVQATAKYLSANFGDFKQIDNFSSTFELIDAQRHFLQVRTLKDDKGLDWLIVVTIPEADFTEIINANNTKIILLCIVALIVATASGILTTRWVIQPILRLNKAAKDITNGEWDKTVELNRKDELGELAQSFNTMASQVQESFSQLEQRVAERTVELQRAKEAAEAASQAKDKFLANISHELRTPLNAVLGYATVLLRERNYHPRQLQGLRIIKQSGTHLLTLINDILDFSKIKASKMELYPSNFDFPTFLEGVVGIIQLLAKEKNNKFEYEFIGDLPNGIRADEKRLRQVLLNLLSNAVKFTDRGLVIFKVRAIGEQKNISSLTSKKICFEIVDTGVGISSTHLEKIFLPFEQVGELQRRAVGTGLGLAIARQIVELMGSELKVKSQLGTGSTFWFDVTLPVVKVVPEGHKQDLATQIIGYKGEQRQILVVDNLEENRLVLLNLLEPIGFKIVLAENGQQALEIISQNPPDLILTDILMPVKTGLVMVQEIRQMREFEDIPIVALSASTFEVMEKQSLAVGCNAFLPKPVAENQLFALLKKYLHLEWVFDSSVQRL